MSRWCLPVGYEYVRMCFGIYTVFNVVHATVVNPVAVNSPMICSKVEVKDGQKRKKNVGSMAVL